MLGVAQLPTVMREQLMGNKRPASLESHLEDHKEKENLSLLL